MSYIESSDNIFVDLGFDPEEAQNLKIRTELMIVIEQYIKREKLTQKAAAGLMGVRPPRISELMHGKIALFSVDKLIKMLAHAGLEVHITVGPAKPLAV